MLDSLGKAWSALKESAFESAAKLYLDQKLAPFGKVARFSLDREGKKMFIEVELLGEVSPISVAVGSYELVERDGFAYLSVRDIAASREWITLALRQYVEGREFKLPVSAARFC